MISTVILLSLYLTRTCSALKLHSPIHIVRPLDDIHSNCEQDIEYFCSSYNKDILNNPSSYLYGSSPKKNKENDGFVHSTYIPEMMADYDKDDEFFEFNKVTEGNRDGQIHSEIARRLTDSESSTTSVSHRSSASIGVHISPKRSNGPDEGAKDSARFLNYGPKTDTCLWNAFTAKQVSTQCASALSYVNDSINAFPMKYGNESETTISVMIPLAPIFLIFLCYILFRELVLHEEENGNEEDEINDDEVDYDHCEYQIIGELKDTYPIAVPLEKC